MIRYTSALFHNDIIDGEWISVWTSWIVTGLTLNEGAEGFSGWYIAVINAGTEADQ